MVKIKSIEIDKTVDKALTLSDSRAVLYAVVVTYKNWIGREFKVRAFPTITGVVDDKGKGILYYRFCGEDGKELRDQDSNQINNYIRNRRILGLI